MSDIITTDSPEAHDALLALTVQYHGGRALAGVDRLKAAAENIVTISFNGERGLTDDDVPLAEALPRLVGLARERYVEGSHEHEYVMTEDDLRFELGTIERLRAVAEIAEEVRSAAAFAAEILAEQYEAGAEDGESK